VLNLGATRSTTGTNVRLTALPHKCSVDVPKEKERVYCLPLLANRLITSWDLLRLLGGGIGLITVPSLSLL
jgi:hypothetical protein